MAHIDNAVYLHRLIDLSAVQHEIVILQIVQGRLPGHVFSLHRQIRGCSQGEGGRHKLSPAEGEDTWISLGYLKPTSSKAISSDKYEAECSALGPYTQSTPTSYHTLYIDETFQSRFPVEHHGDMLQDV